MENLHLNLGDTPKHTIVAKNGIILSQSYGQKFGHAHKMNHNSNNHNNNNHNGSSNHHSKMQQMHIQMERALNGDNSLSLGHHYDSSSSGSNAGGGGGGQGQGHHFNYTHGQTYAHGMDNGDSLAVVSSMREMKGRTQSSYHHSTSPSGTALDSVSAAAGASSSYLYNPQLNVAAASFTPSRSQGLLGLPISSQSQPLLQTPHVSSSQVLVQKSGHGNGHGNGNGNGNGSANGSGHGNGHGHGQNTRWRRQPLPDLFNAVLGLMRELNRSVSYPEIISTLSIRLQRTEADLKRHVPHTLHSAVTNGYLRKDGNRYTLLSELEQVEIMRRNQEAAQRAKELEKEPLSWRKR
ncbi:uncharacterized protein Dwil_GK17544 [Drosophila willistoni]|uniref:DUF4777 domain-containing protein n=1 Tax=Drosophila willistoni TaxID=7260 RepID=B4NP96_DROWI|nr:uncharacterized protein Dwil_GK17544 [Drosophila willistoni]